MSGLFLWSPHRRDTALESTSLNTPFSLLLHLMNLGQLSESELDAAYAALDGDGDGFGDPNSTIEDCDPPPGYVAAPEDGLHDCDDTAAAAFPGGVLLRDSSKNIVGASGVSGFGSALTAITTMPSSSSSSSAAAAAPPAASRLPALRVRRAQLDRGLRPADGRVGGCRAHDRRSELASRGSRGRNPCVQRHQRDVPDLPHVRRQHLSTPRVRRLMHGAPA